MLNEIDKKITVPHDLHKMVLNFFYFILDLKLLEL